MDIHGERDRRYGPPPPKRSDADEYEREETKITLRAAWSVVSRLAA